MITVSLLRKTKKKIMQTKMKNILRISNSFGKQLNLYPLAKLSQVRKLLW